MHLDDPELAVVEGPGVEQFVFWLGPVTRAVLADQFRVGELALRIVIAPAVPGVARGRVEVPPVLLDVLAVVALRAGQAEEPFLEYGVIAVPQREAKAEPLLDVAEASQPV